MFTAMRKKFAHLLLVAGVAFIIASPPFVPEALAGATCAAAEVGCGG